MSAPRTRQCHCQCGRYFELTIGNRRRKFALDCPKAAERAEEQRVRQQEKQTARRAAHRLEQRDARRARQGRRAPEKICAVCSNLSERRPPEGCRRCGLPYGLERRPEPVTFRDSLGIAGCRVRM